MSMSTVPCPWSHVHGPMSMVPGDGPRGGPMPMVPCPWWRWSHVHGGGGPTSMVPGGGPTRPWWSAQRRRVGSDGRDCVAACRLGEGAAGGGAQVVEVHGAVAVGGGEQWEGLRDGDSEGGRAAGGVAAQHLDLAERLREREGVNGRVCTLGMNGMDVNGCEWDGCEF
jgi:hypothetical protein